MYLHKKISGKFHLLYNKFERKILGHIFHNISEAAAQWCCWEKGVLL